MNTEKKNTRRLVAILNLFFILALTAGFFYFVDFEGMTKALLSAKLSWFFLSLSLLVFGYPMSALRFYILLRRQDIKVSLLRLTFVTWGSRFYSFFSPVSSVGTVMRFQRLIPMDRIPEGIAAFGANRMFEIFAAVIMGIFWGLLTLEQEGLSLWSFVVYLAGIVLLIAFIFFASDRLVLLAENKLANAPLSKLAWVYRGAVKFFRAIGMYRALPVSDLLALLGITLIFEVLGMLNYLLIAFSLDIPVSFMDLGWIRSLMILSAVAPLTLPGGFGLREVSGIVLISSMGIDPERATAFSLLLYIRTMLAALIGGVVELTGSLRSLLGREKTS